MLGTARLQRNYRQQVSLLPIKNMEFLARLEANGLAGSYVDLRAGARVASDAGFTGAHIEHAEASKLNPIPVGESLFQAFEYRIHSGLGFHARQTGPFNHMMNDVLFNQRVHPES